MGAFKIEILGVGGHGCDRKAKSGEKLFGRCGRFNCPDCVAYEFVQTLRQKGMLRDGDTAMGHEIPNEIDACTPIPEGAEKYYTDSEYRLVDKPVPGGKTFWRIYHKAEFTHWPGEPQQVVDNMLTNTRKSGSF